MKTRDKILLASLVLFNEEGEPNVTTVDIANEMDISPGNLYYHFKGKGLIIAELYESFDSELVDILNAPLEKALNTEDSWFYLYIVFEHLYKFRFFYQNLSDILQRDEKINKRFRRLLDKKYQATETLLTLLADKGVITLSDTDNTEICENIILVLTHWLTHARFRNMPASEVELIHRGVFQIMSLVAPYFSESYQHIYQECRELYQRLLEQGEVTA